MPEFENDIILLEQLKAGNQRAFDQLYVSYRRWLSLAAMTILRNETEAEEVVQDFFIDFWQHRLYQGLTLSGRRSLKNFLFVSVKNRCLNKLAKDETRRKRFSRLLLPEDYSLPEDKLENEELKVRLDAAMKRLTAGQREVFKMAYVDQRTRREIAATMGISEETVKKQVALALKVLRNYLKETENL